MAGWLDAMDAMAGWIDSAGDAANWLVNRGTAKICTKVTNRLCTFC